MIILCIVRKKRCTKCCFIHKFSPQIGMLSAILVVSVEKTPPQYREWRLEPLPCIVHDWEPKNVFCFFQFIEIENLRGQYKEIVELLRYKFSQTWGQQKSNYRLKKLIFNLYVSKLNLCKEIKKKIIFQKLIYILWIKSFLHTSFFLSLTLSYQSFQRIPMRVASWPLLELGNFRQ